MSTTDSNEGQTELRDATLPRNHVFFIEYSRLSKCSAIGHREKEVRALRDILRNDIDPSVTLDPDIRAKLKFPFTSFTTAEGAYRNKDVIEQAVLLREAAAPQADALKSEWIHDVLKPFVWDFFSLRTTFAKCMDHLWRAFDAALTQIEPRRAALSRPKPSFALGLDFQRPSAMDEMALDYKYHSSPSVDLFVTYKTACPFFICESKSSAGAPRTAENQLATAMTMAHDILCSLDAQDSLSELGLVQLQFTLTFYVSFSARGFDEDRRPFAQDVYIIALRRCVLSDVGGCLSLLRFVEHVKEYGQNTFPCVVKEKIEQVYPLRV